MLYLFIISYALLGILLTAIAGLRYRLGIDTVQYEYYYYQFPTLSNYFSYNFEGERYGRGFLFFVAICKSICPSFVFFQIVHASIINFISFRFFYKYSRNIFSSILFYFLICYFPYNFEVLRESCAVCMLLIGWKYFLSKKWIKYYTLAIIAIMLHPSSVIMALLPLLYIPPLRPFFKLGKTSILFLGGLIVLFLSMNLFDVLKLINIDMLQIYVSLYDGSNYSESSSLNFMGYLNFFLIYVVYPFGAIYLIKKNNLESGKKDKNKIDRESFDKLQFMVTLYVYIGALTLVILIFYRFNNYFAPFAILALSDSLFSTVRLPKIHRKKTISYSLQMLILVPYFVFLTSKNFRPDGFSDVNFIYRYYPYESVLTMEKNAKRERLYLQNGR